ncbi:3-epi-6-deoxocathasterone 23-monooxygenase CYP90C1 [Arabidopsis thaliana]|uniref:3-epi-6-deoxocathasterone 23-monooxygenase CYP90C1 n=3 Tax=Arabidopsis TaxID=3701 RepID=C90C1_ARATH|nr:Cytochrome P450 superfamily protein [Arabidopsis thaliana]Q9M066.3 RecName: Full=3-epi-6-deoxocathasterone 23-monooxygenase CYP90C1; Short=3-dehydro-6-deoxoteasterone; AltName: Full=(22R,23R)-22,23-dihydroxy-campest-4-en-3-one synthase; AltName: Full=(22R,23R)-22,23-dihydroxycampesterol synthase; AltName: Full=6-deoxoteasterone synthase; AltName: Full=Cytochrome P450 90C1; AltName: Full=Protein ROTUNDIFOLIA 3; AltName: Full=Teasterone synthase [Arabidopsis thaliana]KAG7618630.1 Cytochrome P450|eukprot:NP_568002.1 Cytochrome P450 superfamily protein [Arabidopsis thaliana]
MQPPASAGLFRSPENLPWPYNYMDYLVAGFLVLTAGILLRPWLWLRLRNSKTKDGDEEEDNEEKKKGMIPNGSLGWPVIGETLNFIACGYSSRPVTFMDKRKSLYGKVFKTNIIGTPIIISTDAEVNKVVLQNHGNTFVPAYPKSITELLGENSILSINGPHQKRLHTLIGAFLRSPHLKDRITRDIEASVVLTLASWAQLPLVHVQDEIKKMTFEILVKVLMSTSPGEDMNILKLEFEEFIKGLICIPIKFPGTRLYKSLKAKERLIKMVKKVVEERQVAMTTTSPANDVVDVLLRDGGDSEKQSQPSDFVSGKIVEMMIPGEETMPTAMTLAVKFLSDNPVALAKLVEENMEMKRRKLELGEEYKWTDYMSLSFTQNVINETLRMANIINGVWRKALKDVEIKGYLIPKGWCVLASFISVHMDEDIYDNPYQFDPWRWDRINGSANSSICFTPFGGGQRLCPGLELSKLEISIFLHHLVTRYSWTAEEDEIVSFPTVKMKRRLPIRVATVDDSASPISLEDH